MSSDRMEVAEAWRVLGEDPQEVIREIKSRPDRESRMAAAEAALSRAERLAKVLSGVHHPDRNPGDALSTRRFARVQRALESIRFHTDELRNRISRTKDAPESSDPKIVFE